MQKIPKIAIADCETDPFKFDRVPEPFIWGYYDGKTYKSFSRTHEFVKYIQNQDVVIYAHNGGKFDWHYILPFVNVGEDIMIINGRLSKMRIGKCELRDSYNILPVPLSDYKKDDMDYKLMESENRDKPHIRKIIEKYLRGDCIYLYEIVAKFIDDYGFNLTLAGSAMKYWIDKYHKNDDMDRTTSYYYKNMSKFYYGGRVECFEKGVIEDNIDVIDINSAYPDAMRYDHPAGKEMMTVKALPAKPEILQRCFIELNALSTGAFPYRGDDDKLTFPNDRKMRKFFITGWEFIAAAQTDTLLNPKILAVHKYADTINFSEYVDHFYNLKKNAKAKGDSGKADYIFAKLFLNSLYGKTAANPDKYKQFCTREPDEVFIATVEEKLEHVDTISNVAIMAKELEDSKKRFYNVAIAASITGFVRAKLWRAINSADRPLYCDTDSMAYIGNSRVNISEELGDWSYDGKFKSAAIVGKKLYCFRAPDVDDKIASKGVRLTGDDLFAIASGEEITYKKDAPTFRFGRAKFITRRISMIKD